jgi:mannosylglucosylglycerate synthase
VTAYCASGDVTVPLRVALLHYTCPPVVGGVERLIGVHARLFVEHGHAAAVFAGRGRPFDRRVPVHLAPELDPRHPEVRAVGAELDRGMVTPRFTALRDRLVAWWDGALSAFDAVIVHNAFTLHLNLPLTAALHAVAGRAGPSVVAWCHDLSWSQPSYRPRMRERYPWTLLKTCHPAVRYVAVSRDRQATLATLSGVPAEQVAVIPAGIDPAGWFRRTPSARRLLGALALAPEELVLLVPSRITPAKNIELALRVVAALRATGARPRLLVTGPPDPHDPLAHEYFEQLRRLRSALGVEREAVFLHPSRVSDAAVADLFQVADVVFLPSAHEGFGLPLLEAGIARVPVFCSDLPPFREIAGDCVRYFSPGDDPAAIARRLSEFVAGDPATRMRRRMRREYAWEVLFRRSIEPLVARPRDPGIDARPGDRDPGPEAADSDRDGGAGPTADAADEETATPPVT